MTHPIEPVERVEILTLQDNYIDLVSRDDTDVVKRARPLKGPNFSQSVLAEHGFSALVTLTAGGRSRSLLFDFGFSPGGAAQNAEALDADLAGVEAVAVSHGHLDHVGGLEALMGRLGRKGIPLVLHPAAFRSPRFIRLPDGGRINFPPLVRERVLATGAELVETRSPYRMLGGHALFLGEIPRRTPFEQGAPYLCWEDDGVERQDPLEDDTAIVARVENRGLVVLSGCAHAGIVNTVRYAREITGVSDVLAVMGGFHLSGADHGSVVGPTAQALRELSPRYLVPTHCTGRAASLHMEREMPESFLLNMSGTRLTFAS